MLSTLLRLARACFLLQASESADCRKWLTEAERGARISGELTKLRVEEKILYKTLLGLET